MYLVLSFNPFSVIQYYIILTYICQYSKEMLIFDTFCGLMYSKAT